MRTQALKRALTSALVPVVVLGTACDTSVTNPGPTQDAFLDSLNAHQAVAIGARRSLADAMDQIVYWSAAMTFEINPAGSTGSFGIHQAVQAGRFDDDFSGDWDAISQARWVAEDAYRRFERALTEIEGAPALSTYEPAALAKVYAGYSNRVFGDNFCQVVFDGGGPEPHTAAWQRAEGHFTTIIDNLSADQDIEWAARAGRAQVRLNLGNFGGAATDAAVITDNDWTFSIPYFALDQSQFNYIQFANDAEPYRAHTQWATYWQDWGYEATKGTGDPRTPWAIDPANPVGDAAVQKFGGNVTWYPQQKHPERNSPINLASGWEMRLIEAEAALETNDDFAAVEGIINARRNDLGIATVSLSSVAEAWAALKLERGAELFLEARRMGDIRRWVEGNKGAGYDDLTDGVWFDTDMDGVNDTRVEDMENGGLGSGPHDLCYPIGESERETNPNVPS